MHLACFSFLPSHPLKLFASSNSFYTPFLGQKNFQNPESMLEGQRNHLPPVISKIPSSHVSSTQSTYPALLESSKRNKKPGFPWQLLHAASQPMVTNPWASPLWDWRQVQKHSRNVKLLSRFLLAQNTKARQTSVTEQNTVYKLLKKCDSCTELFMDYVHAKRETTKKILWVYREESGYTALTIISWEEKVLNYRH